MSANASASTLLPGAKTPDVYVGGAGVWNSNQSSGSDAGGLYRSNSHQDQKSNNPFETNFGSSMDEERGGHRRRNSMLSHSVDMTQSQLAVNSTGGAQRSMAEPGAEPGYTHQYEEAVGGLNSSSSGPRLGGGYASSVEGEYYSAPPSRLISRTPTPVYSGATAMQQQPPRLSSPDFAASGSTATTTTESEDEYESDYTAATAGGSLGGWGASFFGFGAGQGNGMRAGSSRRGPMKRYAKGGGYHALSTKQGDKWDYDDAGTPLVESQRSNHARGAGGTGTGGKKRWKMYDAQTGVASHQDAPLRLRRGSSPTDRRRQSHRARSGRRYSSSGSRWNPFRAISSLLCKTFRTFFGPIHPITIFLALALIAGFVTSVTMLIIYILNPDKEPLPWRTFCQQQMPFPHAYADALAPVNVMVGIMTVDSKYERRSIIRNTYAKHTLPADEHGNPTANVQVKFVLGKVRKAHARRVALEMEAYNDIIVLDLEETMTARKTHGFFKWASENATVPFLKPVAEDAHRGAQDTVVASPHSPGGLANFDYTADHNGAGPFSDGQQQQQQQQRYEIGWKKVDYVVKADDDSFIFLDELERHLRVAPRRLTYWGYLIKNWFMGGECYALSFDLVNWMARSPEVARSAKGKEDTRTPQWIALHPNRSSINWVSEHCWIYDHPKGGSPYSHGFLFPDYVERIKLEGRKGLSEQEIAWRGGERASHWYSTVTKWHQKYIAPRQDLTVEEEIEALVEGGGRWAGSWVRGSDGSSSEVWVPYDDIVYEADDQRLKPSGTNEMGHSAMAFDVGLEPNSGLPIYGIPGNESAITGDGAKMSAAHHASLASPPPSIDRDQPHVVARYFDRREGPNYQTEDDGDDAGLLHKRRDFLDIASLPKSFLKAHREQSEPGPLPPKAQQQGFTVIDGNQIRLVPRPTSKDGFGDWASLRARRYLNRPHGGTVVVHYLKKTEWWLETAMVFLGQTKMWQNGAGGVGREWRMGGSPLVRHDGYISEGRSQPRPDGSVAPGEGVAIEYDEHVDKDSWMYADQKKGSSKNKKPKTQTKTSMVTSSSTSSSDHSPSVDSSGEKAALHHKGKTPNGETSGQQQQPDEAFPLGKRPADPTVRSSFTRSTPAGQGARFAKIAKEGP